MSLLQWRPLRGVPLYVLSPTSAEMKSPGDSEAGESDAEGSTEGEEEGGGEVDHGIELLVSGKSLEEVGLVGYPSRC